MCLAQLKEVSGGVLGARLWELVGLRRYSHAGGEGRKRKREAGGLSAGPEESEELLGRRRMWMGWDVCMRGLGEREGGGWLSVVAASAVECEEAMLGNDGEVNKASSKAEKTLRERGLNRWARNGEGISQFSRQ